MATAATAMATTTLLSVVALDVSKAFEYVIENVYYRQGEVALKIWVLAKTCMTSDLRLHRQELRTLAWKARAR